MKLGLNTPITDKNSHMIKKDNNCRKFMNDFMNNRYKFVKNYFIKIIN